MNPFLAKLFEIMTDDSWKAVNETVVVFGWDGASNTVLLAREKGQIQVHRLDRIRLRLPNNADILPAGLLQQMQRKVS